MVLSWEVNNNAAPPNNRCIFAGPFFLQGDPAGVPPFSLKLTKGSVIGANNLTVAMGVVRIDGTVDAQLQYSGSVNFYYNSTGPVTSGYELPPASNTSNFQNLTVVGSPLTLNGSKTMNGVLTTGVVLNLGGNTLTI
ncbi:MAG: hypothetical protein ACPL1K_06000, partial [Candidatus Kryptoniota bacterium]